MYFAGSSGRSGGPANPAVGVIALTLAGNAGRPLRPLANGHGPPIRPLFGGPSRGETGGGPVGGLMLVPPGDSG